MEIDAYLQRIEYRGSREPTARTLNELHRAHMFTVPFENLDIRLGHPIILSLPSLYDKIVRRRRGGFCYELNGLFMWLLEQLGFSVVMLSARVFDGPQAGPEFDHLVLLIEGEERLLADVGFGDLFMEPLRFADGAQKAQNVGSYRLTGPDSEKVLQRSFASDWESKYCFSLTPRGLDEFSAMCHYQQTAPESVFTQKVVCSRATPGGRFTLTNNRLITTIGEQSEEHEIAGAEEYRNVLITHFGIELGEGVHLERLMSPGRPLSQAGTESA